MDRLFQKGLSENTERLCYKGGVSVCFTHPEWHLEYSQLITQSHLLPLLSIMVFAQSKCSVNVERNEKESEEKKKVEGTRWKVKG